MKPDVRTTPNETIRRAAAGDKAAIAAVFADAGGLGRWWAGKYGRGDPDITADLHAIARVAVFDAIRTYRPRKGNWASWVTQWMKARMWSSFNLKHHEREVHIEADHEDDRMPPDEQLAREQESAALRQAIAKLPTHLRRVMQGRLAGKTLQGIGDEAGRSRERIRQLEMQALARLRRTLEAA